MARRLSFHYGSYGLTWLNGEACAVPIQRDENGERTGRYRLGVHQRDGIEACRAKFIAYVRSREVQELATDTTIAKVFEGYCKYLRTEGKAEVPAITVWKHLGRHFGFLVPDDMSDELCHAYAVEREKAGASPGTIWTELNRLSCALNWAYKKRVIPRKISVWQPLKPEGKKNVLSVKQVLALYDQCLMPHMQLFVLVTVMGGGPRSGAVLELEWDRVDLEKGTINFKKEKQVSVLHKGHKKHRAKVPMTDTLRTTLQQHKELAVTPFVIEYAGTRVQSVKKAFAAACRRAGIEDCTPHTLRHTVATWLDEEGEDSKRIAQVLGHLDPKTTQKIYTHTREHALKPTVDKLDVFKNRGLRVVGGTG